MGGRSPYVVVPAIAGVIGLLYLAGIAVTIVAGLPWEMRLPWVLRPCGFLLVVVGGALVGWVVRRRGWRATLESTHASLVKLVRRAPLATPLGRTEPLVVEGPYRVVRHPLYSGVIILTIGVALAVDRTAALLGALFLWAWFALVLCPFEERELVALFGKAYEEYRRRTPRLVPIPWRRSRNS